MPEPKGNLVTPVGFPPASADPVALLTDTEGRLNVFQRPYKATVTTFRGNIPGGGSVVVVDTGTGLSGFFIAFAGFMQTTANDVRLQESRAHVFIDGEATPSINSRWNSGRHDLVKGFIVGMITAADAVKITSPLGWQGTYGHNPATTNKYVMSGGFQLISHFTNRLVVRQTNGDPINQTYFNVSAIYATWL